MAASSQSHSTTTTTKKRLDRNLAEQQLTAPFKGQFLEFSAYKLKMTRSPFQLAYTINNRVAQAEAKLRMYNNWNRLLERFGRCALTVSTKY